MNVTINPTTGKAGHSFKDAHMYMMFGKKGEETPENRIHFFATHNIGIDDPEHAYKIMIATAQAQDTLKRANGVKVHKSTHGPVDHHIIEYHNDEPTDDPEKIKADIQEYLSHIGVDPAKQRGKAKKKVRQFADEHQVLIYGHGDTDNYHVHLIINRVHPQHGRLLPDNNDQLKASAWALEYSKRHGTDHHTPAREENMEARKRGEYVKGQKRKSRPQYDREQALKAISNDNDKIQGFLEGQRKKDTILYAKGRNMHALHRSQSERLIEIHHDRKAAIDRWLQSATTKTKAEQREEFRPLWRELKAYQKKERTTFEGLEQNFFGRAGNIVKTVHLSAKLLREDTSGIIGRTFAILTNAGDRKRYFERAQKRAQQDLKRKQNLKLDKLILDLKNQHRTRLRDNRTVFKYEQRDLKERQAIKSADLQKEWAARNDQRIKAFAKFKTALQKITDKFTSKHDQEPKAAITSRARALLDDIKAREQFEQAQDGKAEEQENTKDNDGENER